MNSIQEKFNELQLAFLSRISLRIGLMKTNSEANILSLEADSSIPSRGIGLLIFLFSLLPFHSDFLEDPSSNSFLNGYDFYNHSEAIFIRLLIALPALYIFLIYGKVTRCTLDKNNNTFLIEQKNYLFRQKSEGNLQGISGLEISQAERSGGFRLGGGTFTYVEVNFLRDSAEKVSLTFIEQTSEIDNSIEKVHNMLSDFLDIPSPSS